MEIDGPEAMLVNQQQVYLPTNNALSDVGHVHLFLEQLGQGIQHLASRVPDLVAFIQRANTYREVGPRARPIDPATTNHARLIFYCIQLADHARRPRR